MGIKLYHIALVLLLISGCKKDNPGCFTRIGDEIRYVQDLGDFTSIEVYDQLDIILISDSSRQGQIETLGPEHVIPNIHFSREGSKLIIEDKNRCRWFRTYGRLEIKIFIDQLERISSFDNSAFISIDRLKLDHCVFDMYSVHDQVLHLNAGTFEVNHYESGTVKLSGYCAVFIPTEYYSGLIESGDMQSDFAFVYHYGINDIYVHPYKELEVRIENSGNVYYDQQPLSSPVVLGRGTGELKFDP